MGQIRSAWDLSSRGFLVLPSVLLPQQCRNSEAMNVVNPGKSSRGNRAGKALCEVIDEAGIAQANKMPSPRSVVPPISLIDTEYQH